MAGVAKTKKAEKVFISEAEDLDEAGSIQCTCSLEILVSHIIHTEEQSRNQHTDRHRQRLGSDISCHI